MAQALDDIRKRFIDTWGDMASSWGVSRTMAQIYALLYAHPDALDTDTIMQQLGISRGNANMNLHKLLDWELVHKEERADTRKDYYRAEGDVWTLTLQIIRERQHREITPVANELNEMAASLSMLPEDDANTDEVENFRAQLNQMAEVLHLFDKLTEAVLPLLKGKDAESIRGLLNMLSMISTPTT